MKLLIIIMIIIIIITTINNNKAIVTISVKIIMKIIKFVRNEIFRQPIHTKRNCITTLRTLHTNGHTCTRTSTYARIYSHRTNFFLICKFVIILFETVASISGNWSFII